MGNPKKIQKTLHQIILELNRKKLVEIKESKCKIKQVNNRLLITVKKENVIILLFCEEMKDEFLAVI